MNSRIAAAIVLSATVSLAACKSPAPEQLPPEPGVSQPTTGGNTGGPGVGTQEHFVRAVNGQNVIYFDTDRYNIDTADAAALQTQAQYMSQYPNITVTIEGHADEQGTREYNLALGARRANAAREYLISRGIAASRLRVVSYGKERPIEVCSSEACYAKNRRAVTVLAVGLTS